MSYFDDVQAAFENVKLWADLRHEQGDQQAGRMMAALKRQLIALKRTLESAKRSPAAMKREPNDLEAIRALRTKGPRRIWPAFDAAVYADRIRGAFLGRAAGCTLGASVEGWSPERMRSLAKYLKMSFPPSDYWTGMDEPYSTRYGVDRKVAYTKPAMRYLPVDDDITYTLLGLLVLEDYGPDFTTADVGKAWLKYLPLACTAEKVALDNLKAGRSWKQTGVKDNPFMEWIGADIRSDPWGYVCPGWPEKAAELAYRDAYLSHRYNGIYGEMYFAAVIAAAFAVNDPVEAMKIGLTEIPATCRLYEDVSWALDAAPKVTDYAKAYELVQKRFGPIQGGMSAVHTNNNACLTVWGITIGRRNFTKVIAQTVAMSFDNDCTAATAGSIVGAVVGGENIPSHWYKPFRNRCRTYLTDREWFAIPDIYRRFTLAAKAVADASPLKVK